MQPVGYLLSRNLSSYTVYQPRQSIHDRCDVNTAIDKITPKLGDNRILAELVHSPNLALCLRLAAACSDVPLSYIPYGIELPRNQLYTRQSPISTVDDTNEAALRS